MKLAVCGALLIGAASWATGCHQRPSGPSMHVLGLVPSAIDARDRVTVQLRGEGFVAQIDDSPLDPPKRLRARFAVWIDDELLSQVDWISATELRAGPISGLTPGWHAVRVERPDGRRAHLSQGLLVLGQACQAPANDEGPLVQLTPADSAELPARVAEAGPGAAFVLADGVYSIDAPLEVRSSGVTLRSASGRREAVVIEGRRDLANLVRIDADDVTLSALTVAGAAEVGVSIGDERPARRASLVDVAVLDAGRTALRIDALSDHGRLACARLASTAGGQAAGCSEGLPEGLRATGVGGWTIFRSEFSGFRCDGGGLTNRALRASDGSSGFHIERNRFSENAIALAFGPGSPAEAADASELPPGCVAGAVDYWGGTVCSNVIWSPPGLDVDSGIALWRSCDVEVLHNTVVLPEAAFSGIEVRLLAEPNALIVQNNLLLGAGWREREGAAPQTRRGDLEGPAGENLVDLELPDLHLRAESPARAAGAPLSAGRCMLDMDGEPREPTRPDVGADSFSEPATSRAP